MGHGIKPRHGRSKKCVLNPSYVITVIAWVCIFFSIPFALLGVENIMQMFSSEGCAPSTTGWSSSRLLTFTRFRPSATIIPAMTQVYVHILLGHPTHRKIKKLIYLGIWSNILHRKVKADIYTTMLHPDRFFLCQTELDCWCIVSPSLMFVLLGSGRLGCVPEEDTVKSQIPRREWRDAENRRKTPCCGCRKTTQHFCGESLPRHELKQGNVCRKRRLSDWPLWGHYTTRLKN